MGKKRKPGWGQKDAAEQPAPKKSKNEHPAAPQSSANTQPTEAPPPPTAAVDPMPKSERSDAGPPKKEFRRREHKTGPRPGRPDVSDDRRREAVLYDQLRSEDARERIAAADGIVTRLFAGEGVSEAELERHLEKKLFPGLSSGKKGSRLGYSLVITEILRELFRTGGPAAADPPKYPRLTVEHLLGLLKTATTARGNISGQAERDFYFGRLFGAECFVKADVLFSAGGETERWRMVLETLLDLAKKKIWLKSQCGWIVVQCVPRMERQHAELTVRVVADASMADTPEGVAVWVAAVDKFNDLKVPSKPWKHPLASGSLPKLAAVLTESITDDSIEPGLAAGKLQQTSPMGQLHCVWDVILNHYIQKSKSISSDAFASFWLKTVDERLFSKNASNFQKFRGLMVFSTFLQGFASNKVNPDLIPKLFSKHLMTCLMNHAAEQDRYLHRAALKALAAVDAAAVSNPEAVKHMLRSLLIEPGIFNFDQRTKTQTVAKVLHHVPGTDTNDVITVLKEGRGSWVHGDSDGRMKYLRVFAEYLYNLTCSGDASDNGHVANRKARDWALKELVDVACFKPNDLPTDWLSEDLRSFYRDQLQKSLTRLIRVGDIEYLCRTVMALDASTKEMEDEIVVVRDAALRRMKHLMKRGFSKGDSEAAAVSQSLALLHAVAIVQLYMDDPDALNFLSDLERLEVKEGAGSEFLVEVLLSLIGLHSSLARQVSQQVFEAFAGHMSAKALELLTDVLAAEENAAGHAALFQGGDEMEVDVDGSDASPADSSAEDSDDSSDSNSDSNSDSDSDSDSDSTSGGSDDKLDSDVEVLEMNGTKSDSGAESDSDSEDKEDDPELAALDDALAEVLRSHRLDKDKDAPPSDSDSDMSDSEMMALDDKLAEVFKQRAAKGGLGGAGGAKKEARDAKERVMYFKQRVLDLLFLYVRSRPLAPQALTTLPAVLALIRRTTDRSLANRAAELVRTCREEQKKARGRKQAAGSDGEAAVDAEAQLGLLRLIHDEAWRDQGAAFVRSASAASLMVAGSLYAMDPENIRGVAGVYADTMARMVLKGEKVGGVFFAEWANWCHALAERKG